MDDKHNYFTVDRLLHTTAHTRAVRMTIWLDDDTNCEVLMTPEQARALAARLTETANDPVTPEEIAALATTAGNN